MEQAYGQVFAKWEPESISPRIWNETRVLTISGFIQCGVERLREDDERKRGLAVLLGGDKSFPPRCLSPGTHKVDARADFRKSFLQSPTVILLMFAEACTHIHA